MFDRIKKSLTRSAHAGRVAEAVPSRLTEGPVSEWAATQGLVFSAEEGGMVTLEGRVQGKRWRMERGRPTREYIVGEELRARAQLELGDDIAVMVMNRSLSDRLEHQAYVRSVDHVETGIDGSLPPEVRWLALYQDTVWTSLPEPFWNRYSVHTDRPDMAQRWIDQHLAGLLLQWPQPGPSNDVPFTLLLMQGKAYLRMEYRPADLPILQHAALIFTSACESAVRSSIDLAL